MNTKIIDVTLLFINERREPLQQALCEGTAKDHSEYLRLCGELRGLAVVEMYLRHLAKKLEQDDDD
jgi:hypothetical protein